MMKSYLLGIDIGTSACKVAVFDTERQSPCRSQWQTIRYTIHRKAGRSRIRRNGGVLYAGRRKKTVQKAGIAPAEIAGVGIDGQSWSAIALDKEGRVLTNTPIWMDTRAQDICERLNEEIGAG